MPARKAKSVSKSPTESMLSLSTPQGTKRRKTSDETPKAKKRKVIQGQASEAESEYVPSAKDLISDVPRDENFTIDMLLPDLATSYVGRFKTPVPVRPERKAWPRQSSPLIDPDKLPSGWSMAERDLSPHDLDAQIERCHVRIKENIMPHIFEHRLKGLKFWQAGRIALRESEPGNHSLEVLKRLEILRNMEVELQSLDDFNQLPNVRALLKAYRGGTLHWNQEMVTYWSKGVQLCEPRPFNWDEFEVLNAHHSGRTGFWMEGLLGPGPSYSLAAIGLGGQPPPNGFFIRTYMIAIRVPGTRWYAELEFIYDTGASIMTLYAGDLQHIMGRSTGEPQVMGLNTVELADGRLQTGPVVELEVTILDTDERRMTKWVRVQCQVDRGWSNGLNRLDGPWLRQMLYTASAPRGEDDMLWIANSYPQIIAALPDTGDTRSAPTLVPAKLPLDPGGRPLLWPRGRPGPQEPAPPVLRQKMPRAA
ncbi:hypothetical protein N7517_008818 [Penicillium concentricum]|uniref:Uncharacterized protein n=1 Tax=Penicillium concentricum TaxID=293559 RepID=A0A9W9RT20_9EURO|nr:uncharacterized protein N7517_008818 [Penicillium concentricum]KAJ5365932.1 hypothetical protein N7517_008818 [Penicillium concentricum]